MAKAAQARLEPTDLSFVQSLHTIQYELNGAATTRAQGKLPALLQRLRERLISATVEKRRGRECPRVVKSRPKRYTVRYLKKDLN